MACTHEVCSSSLQTNDVLSSIMQACYSIIIMGTNLESCRKRGLLSTLISHAVLLRMYPPRMVASCTTACSTPRTCTWQFVLALYRRTGFNCVAKSLRFRVLNAYCVFNNCVLIFASVKHSRLSQLKPVLRYRKLGSRLQSQKKLYMVKTSRARYN